MPDEAFRLGCVAPEDLQLGCMRTKFENYQHCRQMLAVAGYNNPRLSLLENDSFDESWSDLVTVAIRYLDEPKHGRGGGVKMLAAEIQQLSDWTTGLHWFRESNIDSSLRKSQQQASLGHGPRIGDDNDVEDR